MEIESEKSVSIFVLSNIIRAINLGHNPINALKLKDDNFVVDEINLKDFTKSKKRIEVIKSRVIGKSGSTKKMSEDMCECDISVEGNYICVIGEYSNVLLLIDALKLLIKGATHKSYFNFLEKNKNLLVKNLI